jgi:hypothetical protein
MFPLRFGIGFSSVQDDLTRCTPEGRDSPHPAHKGRPIWEILWARILSGPFSGGDKSRPGGFHGGFEPKMVLVLISCIFENLNAHTPPCNVMAHYPTISLRFGTKNGILSPSEIRDSFGRRMRPPDPTGDSDSLKGELVVLGRSASGGSRRERIR